jgi:hypothetical protein
MLWGRPTWMMRKGEGTGRMRVDSMMMVIAITSSVTTKGAMAAIGWVLLGRKQ